MRLTRTVVLAVALGAAASGCPHPGGGGPAPKPQQGPDPGPGYRQMVATAHPVATRAGLAVLREGGNAMDAAVAAAMVLAVVEPHSSGLGGGGFLLVWDAKKRRLETLDFRERAPFAATEKMYQKPGAKRLSRSGHLAVATPGQAAGLALAAKRYGTRPWARLLAPAHHAARGGFAVTPALVRALKKERRALCRFPESCRIFVPRGKPLAVGDRLRQPDLAWTFDRLRKHGPRDFYHGAIARRIVAEMKRGGGLVSMADLARYRPRWGRALSGRYRGYDVYSMGSPSSGGAHLIQMLNILSGFALHRHRPAAPARLHLIAESMRIAFADRARYQGDASFVKVPIRGLTSPRYAALLRRRISISRAAARGTVKPGRPMDFEKRGRPDVKHTSHLSVIDSAGNAVSMTLTINTRFGSHVTAAGTGIVLNNEMDDFTSHPERPNAFGLIQGRANAIAPGKTPLSSMTPTLIFRGGELRGVLGSPGGPTIISTVLQMALLLIDHGFTPERAVRFPRIHHQWMPRELWVERPGPSNEALAHLRRMGHRLKIYKSTWGNAMALWIDAKGRLRGAADPRGDGVAGGF